MGFIRAVVGFSVAILLTIFAVFNRHAVEVSLGLLPISYEFPFYLVALSFMAAGFVFGGAFVWFSGAGVRRDRRHQAKKVKDLEKELEGLDMKSDSTSVPASEFFPALPARRKSST